MRKLGVGGGAHTKGGSIHRVEHEPMALNAFVNIASTSEKLHGKMQSKSRPPQRAPGDGRDYESPQFTHS